MSISIVWRGPSLPRMPAGLFPGDTQYLGLIPEALGVEDASIDSMGKFVDVHHALNDGLHEELVNKSSTRAGDKSMPKLPYA